MARTGNLVSNRKSGVSSEPEIRCQLTGNPAEIQCRNPAEIQCRFIILAEIREIRRRFIIPARKDEPSPDYARHRIAPN